MPPLIWSPAALNDVRRLYRFLADKDQAAAERAVGIIRDGLKLIARQPEAGRPVEEMPPEFRQWPIGFGGGGYLALYRYDGRKILVVAVRHQREAGYSRDS